MWQRVQGVDLVSKLHGILNYIYLIVEIFMIGLYQKGMNIFFNNKKKILPLKAVLPGFSFSYFPSGTYITP